MKYETYKKLTTEQKEEWTFKYKDNDPPFVNTTTYAILLWLSAGVVILATGMLLKDFPVGTPPGDSAFKLLVDSLTIGRYFVIGFVVEIVYFLTVYLYKKWKEYRWLKATGVK